MSNDIASTAWSQIAAFNTGDWEALAATLVDGGQYEEVTTGRTTTTIADEVAQTRGWKDAFPDATGTAVKTFVDGNTVIFELIWTGTHRGDMELPNGVTLPATGKQIRVSAVMIATVEDGKIKASRHYPDIMAMMSQLGVIPV